MSAHRRAATPPKSPARPWTLRRAAMLVVHAFVAFFLLRWIALTASEGPLVLLMPALVGALYVLVSRLRRAARQRDDAAARVAQGRLFCTVVGSSVPELTAGSTVLVDLLGHGMARFGSGGQIRWLVPHAELTDVSIYGPGAVAHGGGGGIGGFVDFGDGFGLGGLISSPTKITVDTRLSLTSARGAVTLHTSEVVPLQLDQILGNVLAGIRHRASMQTFPATPVPRPLPVRQAR